ncbi:hypothetical protein JXA63_00040 [Candidatus Woesebacteria bacterium]|nr:hypothetical protein [Candidatus Woesebacteria bacterium]
MSIKINNKEDKTYIVLGAPHSATSFISKILEESGVEMNNNMDKLYQDYTFWSTNVRILKKAGGSWDKPPSEKKILATKQDHRIKKHIKRKKSKMWGFKDPRTSLTIKKYLPHLDGDVYLICCFRKPKKILTRNRSKKVTKKLLDRYNRSIISAIKEFVEL